MRQGSAVTSQRRLAIYADSTSVDLVLSAAVPVGSLIPSVVDALAGSGGVDADLTAVTCQLSRPDGSVLDVSKTLSELGIRDGCTLFLTRCRERFVPPPCDDAAESVSAAIAEAQTPPTRRVTRLVGALVSGCLASVTAVVLVRTAFGADDVHRTGCVGVAGTTSLLALLAAVIAYRFFDEQGAGVTFGLMGSGFAALAGLFAIPGGPGIPNALLAAAAAAASATAVRVFAGHAVVFTATACLATACAAAAAVGTVIAAPPWAVGAGLAVISLAFLEVAAPVSIMLARLSAQLPVASEAVSDQLRASAIRAHIWLTSLVAAFSGAAALGAISAVLATSANGAMRLPSILFATVVGGVLVLRPRAQDVGRSVPPIVCGAITLSAVLVASAVAYPHHALHIAALSMLLSILALYLGFISESAVVSPTGRRSVELVQYFALASVAPLGFWLCGLYSAARSLNLP